MEGQRTVTSVRSRHLIGEVRNLERAVARRDDRQCCHRRDGRGSDILHRDGLVLRGHGTAVAVGHRHPHRVGGVAVRARDGSDTRAGGTARGGGDIQVARPFVGVAAATRRGVGRKRHRARVRTDLARRHVREGHCRQGIHRYGLALTGCTVRGRVLHHHRHRLGARGGPLGRDGGCAFATDHRSALADTPRVAVTIHVVGAQRQHIVGQRTRGVQTDVVVAGDGQRQGVVHRHLNVLRLHSTSVVEGGIGRDGIGISAGQQRFSADSLRRRVAICIFSIGQSAVRFKGRNRQRGVRVGDDHRIDALSETDGLLLVRNRQGHQRVHMDRDGFHIRAAAFAIQTRQRGGCGHRDRVVRHSGHLSRGSTRDATGAMGVNDSCGQRTGDSGRIHCGIRHREGYRHDALALAHRLLGIGDVEGGQRVHRDAHRHRRGRAAAVGGRQVEGGRGRGRARDGGRMVIVILREVQPVGAHARRADIRVRIADLDGRYGLTATNGLRGVRGGKLRLRVHRDGARQGLLVTLGILIRSGRDGVFVNARLCRRAGDGGRGNV